VFILYISPPLKQKNAKTGYYIILSLSNPYRINFTPEVKIDSFFQPGDQADLGPSGI